MSGPLSNPFMFKSAAGAGAFHTHQIANSARFTSSGVLTRTAGTATNEDKFTISCWVKRSKLGATQHFIFGDQSNIHYQRLSFNSSDKLEMHEQRGGGDSNGVRTISQVFRDTSAWQHIVWTYDTAQGTDTNREKFYVNGSQLTNVEGWDGDYPAQNRDSVFNKDGSTLKIGGASSYYGNYFQGYMAEVVFCDGQAYAASDFGETKNGVWIPKDPSGLTFGNNGFYLNFANASDMGNDVSGNNNDFTESNVDTHDQMTDTPTFNSSSNGGNFATMNPLSNGSNPVLGEGNLMMDSFSGSDISGSLANFALPPSSGKWYFECFINSPNSGDNYPFIGLTATNYSQSATMGVSQRDLSINLGTGGSEKNETYVGSITTDFTSVSAYADNTVCGVFVDMDARKLWYAKDGAFTNSGNPQDGTNPNYVWTNNIPLLPHFVSFGSYGADSVFNFGQEGTFAGNVTAGGNADVTGYGNFKYDPGDYKALCAGNLPVADAINPSLTSDDYPQKLFSPVLYTGNGSSQSVTGVGFQPDFVWLKNRNDTQGHKLFDSSRGVTKVISSHNNDTQSTESGLSAFGSDGFSFGGSTVAGYNTSSNTYVAWNWRANGGSTSSGSGDLTSTHQVDPSGGFSIVKAVGDGGSGDKTVTHGLSAAPDCILSKNLDTSYNWDTYWSSGTTATKGLRLNTTDNQLSGRWGTVNSSIITCKHNYTWYSTNNYIYYCFRNIEGYIKVGNYLGNGDGSDGTFVYTGFKPAFLLVRKVGTNNWRIQDNTRDPYNPAYHMLVPNSSAAEDAYTDGTDYNDFLSNGFKLARGGDAANWNANGSTYVFLAMAHNPFKYATAR